MHHLLVHLCPEIKVGIMVRTRRTSRLDQNNPKVVYHEEVVWLPHVVGLVETTLVSVVIASQVSSSAVKSFTS